MEMDKIKDAAKDFAKVQAKNVFASYIGTLKAMFTFKGRSTRFEFWTYFVGCLLLNIVLGICLGILSYVFSGLILKILWSFVGLINLVLFIAFVSVSVRRLHDLDLTGFWMWYLAPMGLPVVFMVNLLDLDASCATVTERITKICNNWFAWLLLPIFWFIGAPSAMFLLFLYSGKPEANKFGPSPYVAK